MNKPFSPSAERNKDAILNVLKLELVAGQRVLEIGSGTGQHIAFFAQALADVTWQPTELEPNIQAINDRLAEHHLKNVQEAIMLDVDAEPWSISHADVCYTCNTLHIVSIQSVYSIFKACARVLSQTGKLCVYGPFSIDGQHISQSNVLFDQHLRASNPISGVRDLTELNTIAHQWGFKPCRYTAMPSNNFFAVWERSPASTP